MISAGEIASLNRALASYEAFATRLRAVADDASITLWLTGARQRMDEIADEAEANVARFYSRRDQLVEQDPTDHEAIAAFVSGIADATSTRLVEAMASELAVKDPAAFVAAVAGDTWRDLKVFIVAGIVILGAFLFFVRR